MLNTSPSNWLNPHRCQSFGFELPQELSPSLQTLLCHHKIPAKNVTSSIPCHSNSITLLRCLPCFSYFLYLAKDNEISLDSRSSCSSSDSCHLGLCSFPMRYVHDAWETLTPPSTELLHGSTQSRTHSPNIATSQALATDELSCPLFPIWSNKSIEGPSL